MLRLVAGSVRQTSVRPLSLSARVSDRSRQPTGRAGMPSPWLRTPFFHERGPPAGVDKSLQERLDDLYSSDPERGERVDIGFAGAESSSSEKMRISEWRRKTRANKELEKEDVKLFFVDGDVCTNALLAVAHDHLLACDLVYGRSDGGFLSISKEEFQEFKDEHLSLRLFKYLICNKPNSPNGYLATYRCKTRNISLSCFLRERRKTRRKRKIMRREKAEI